MSDNFDTTLPIRYELRKELIFGLESRLPIAIILGYSGYQHQVMPLMQRLSQTTRVYVINANGLPSFLKPLEIIKVLKDAEKSGHLDRAKKYQLIDMRIVEAKLRTSMLLKEKMSLLSKEYPSLFVFILELLNMPDKIE